MKIPTILDAHVIEENNPTIIIFFKFLCSINLNIKKKVIVTNDKKTISLLL